MSYRLDDALTAVGGEMVAGAILSHQLGWVGAILLGLAVAGIGWLAFQYQRCQEIRSA